ncbi:MAG: DUF1156 domain-containing protein [Candidatus Nanopusillus acidilobi]
MAQTFLEKGIKTKRLNEEARREKLGHTPITLIHFWPTRKPLIVSRAVILGALATENVISREQFEKLIFGDDKNGEASFKFTPWKENNSENSSKDAKKQTYFSKPDNYEAYERVLENAKKIYGDLTLYDPFAGSGMIGFEALRLGLNVELSDINPIAYLIMKASIEYPKKYGKKLVDDVEREGKRIIEELKKDYEKYYPRSNGEEVKYYLWSWAVKCPYCGRITPIVDDWKISPSKYVSYEIEGDNIKFSIKEKINENDGKGNENKGKARCLFCEASISNEDIVKDISENKREIMLCIATNREKFFTEVDDQIKSYQYASLELKNRWEELGNFIPKDDLPKDFRSHKYLQNMYNLFNDRQLLIISSLAKKIRETIDYYAEKDRDYAKAIGASLVIWLGKIIDFNSRSTHWKTPSFAIGDVMAYKGAGMMWKHPETNVFSKSSGSLSSLLDQVVRGLEYSVQELKDSNSMNINIGSALIENDKKYSMIITDPPYHDDVAYSELSEFFYSWYKNILNDYFLEAFNYENVDSSEAIEIGGDRDEEIFYSRFFEAMKNLYKSLNDNGILVLFFAHSNLEVWKKITQILYDSGFHITSAIPISTENEASVMARGKRSIYYSLIITLRKRVEYKETTYSSLLNEIRTEIDRQKNEIAELDYDQGELLLWSVGLGLRVLTKYQKIESFTQSNITSSIIDYVTELIQKVYLDEETKKLVGPLPIDSLMYFYLSVLRDGSREIDTDKYNQLCKSFNLQPKDLEENKLVIIMKNKGANRIKVNDSFSRAELLGNLDKIAGSSVLDKIQKCIVESTMHPIYETVIKYAQESIWTVENFILALYIIYHFGKNLEMSNGYKDNEMLQLEKILKEIKKLGLIKNQRIMDEFKGEK